MHQPILRTRELRDIEKRHAHDRPPLMERAGAAAADAIAELQRGLAGPPLIFAGLGNNGGDAFVAARLLRRQGMAPEVVSLADPDTMPADARAAWQAWRAAGGRESRQVPSGRFGAAVDGLFGIGLARPIDGIHAEWVERINAYAGPVLALDCPSGLDADTGRCPGPTVHASHTLTFIALKPGLLTLDGPDRCGEIRVANLGLGAALSRTAVGRTVDRSAFAECLRPRLRNSHKGSYGSVAVIGGARGFAGAPLLAARAALKLGSGRVYVGMLEALAVDPGQAELMLRMPDEAMAAASVLAVGPGMGDSTAARELLRQAVGGTLPLVVDADGINLLAAHPTFQRQLARREAPTLLTPHPLEAARLLGCELDRVQADRVAAALELAVRLHAHVALKGCGTAIASPDGRWSVNATGNPGLASAGSGDVLTGIVAALLAQGWPPGAALEGAVHLHGAAADGLAASVGGPLGLVASELPDVARKLLNQWIADA